MWPSLKVGSASGKVCVCGGSSSCPDPQAKPLHSIRGSAQCVRDAGCTTTWVLLQRCPPFSPISPHKKAPNPFSSWKSPVTDLTLEGRNGGEQLPLLLKGLLSSERSLQLVPPQRSALAANPTQVAHLWSRRAPPPRQFVSRSLAIGVAVCVGSDRRRAGVRRVLAAKHSGNVEGHPAGHQRPLQQPRDHIRRVVPIV